MSIISAQEAIARLEAGNVVAIPTETVYGLAARIDDAAALRRVFEVKQRPFFDPLIVHVADVAQAKLLTRNWLEVYDVLVEAFWPGPLTFVADKTEAVSPLITSGLDTVAIRCPRHPVALQILREIHIPLAAPSANRFGRVSPTQAAHVIAEFGDEVPVVDGGASEVGVESTVIRVDGKRIEILRPGGVSRIEIKQALAARGLSFEITRAESQASPGHLKTHYQPTSPVVIVENRPWSEELKSRAEQMLDSKFAYVHELSLGVSPQLAARRLYENFRDLSSAPGSLIAVVRTPENSTLEWEAIWDRIERASSLRF